MRKNAVGRLRLRCAVGVFIVSLPLMVSAVAWFSFGSPEVEFRLLFEEDWAGKGGVFRRIVRKRPVAGADPVNHIVIPEAIAVCGDRIIVSNPARCGFAIFDKQGSIMHVENSGSCGGMPKEAFESLRTLTCGAEGFAAVGVANGKLYLSLFDSGGRLRGRYNSNLRGGRLPNEISLGEKSSARLTYLEANDRSLNVASYRWVLGEGDQGPTLIAERKHECPVHVDELLGSYTSGGKMLVLGTSGGTRVLLSVDLGSGTGRSTEVSSDFEKILWTDRQGRAYLLSPVAPFIGVLSGSGAHSDIAVLPPDARPYVQTTGFQGAIAKDPDDEMTWYVLFSERKRIVLYKMRIKV